MMDNINYDGIAILETPINMGDETVYAFLFNSSKEEQYKDRDFRRLGDYIAYNKGLERWLQNGGKILDHFSTFEFSNGVRIEDVKGVMCHILSFLFRGITEYKTYVLDEPIQYEQGEVFDCAIISKALVNRIKEKIESDGKTK